jgi:isoamylase
MAFDGLKGPDAQLVPGNDLVSYNEKHNEANGEYNRDGHSNNLSWNHGVDGPTDDQAVKALRFQQTRNLLATLLLSRGTPMILAGDEVARTRTGNNNAYAQGNEISWLDWEGIDTGAWDLFGFAKKLD